MRKSFKVLSVVLCLILAFTSLTACGEKGVTFTPGTYEGVGKGIHGDIKVAVTVDKTSILDIQIVEQNESVGISDMALQQLPSDIIKYQSLAVDAIAGASMTSNGIIEAVKMALEAAGGNIELLTQPIDKSAIKAENVTKDTEIVIIGAGGAGLAAAVSAHQAGSKVIVVEKMPKVGGNTLICGAAYNTSDPERQAAIPANAGPVATIEGLIGAKSENEQHKALQEKVKAEYEAWKKAGSKSLFDSPSYHALQTYEGGDRAGNLDLIINFTNNTLPTLKWLEGLGLQTKDQLFTVLGALWPRSHHPVQPLGTGYISAVETYCKDNGIEILLNTDVDQVVMKDGRAVGIVATGKDGETVTINASKGVVMAAGGFGANVEMRQKYDTQWGTLGAETLTTNHPGATGDGLVMGEAVGAALTGMEYIQLLPMGDPQTGSLTGNIETTVENRIFVNKEGNRFVAEDARRDVMTKALYEQTDDWMWVVLDSHSYPSDSDKNNFNETIGDLVKEGRAFKGETLADLAKQIGVPAEALEKSVADYNKNVDSKTKDQFGRTLYKDKIDKGPFYAGARKPTVHHTMGGLVIDTQCHVIDANGNIIPGLYAAGEVTGGIHGTNRLGGNAIPDAFTHGKIAGETASTGK